MIGVDTNVLVRFLVVGDNPKQAAVARALFASERIAVSHTVLLEAEWVLRTIFGFPRERIADAFFHLLALPTVFCAREESMRRAIRAFEAGCDFADALHAIAFDREVAEFVTFDRDFAKQAEAQRLTPRVRLI